MEKGSDGLILGAAALLLLSQNKAPAQQQQQTPAGAGAGAGGSDLWVAVGTIYGIADKVVTGVAGTGILGLVAGWIKGLISGTSATGGAATGGATAGAGGATGGTSGGAAGAGGGTSVPAILAIGPVGIVALAVFVVIAVAAFILGNQEQLKKAFKGGEASSGFDMLKFENALFESLRNAVPMGGAISKISVSDNRLLNISQGSPSRAAYNYAPDNSPAPDWMGGGSKAEAFLTAIRQLRAISLQYIAIRNEMLGRVATGFYPDLFPPGWAHVGPYQLHELYNSNEISLMFGVRQQIVSGLEGKLGGLADLPLLDGRTLFNDIDPSVGACGRPCDKIRFPQYKSAAYPSEVFYLAKDATPDEQILGTPAGLALIKTARLYALANVFSVFQYDPTVVFVWEDYARFVFGRLGLDDSMAYFKQPTSAEPWWGWTFVTRASYFGQEYAFDCWKIRDMGDNMRPSSRIFKRNAGVPMGDPRLNAIWKVS